MGNPEGVAVKMKANLTEVEGPSGETSQTIKVHNKLVAGESTGKNEAQDGGVALSTPFLLAKRTTDLDIELPLIGGLADYNFAANLDRNVGVGWGAQGCWARRGQLALVEPRQGLGSVEGRNALARGKLGRLGCSRQSCCSNLGWWRRALGSSSEAGGRWSSVVYAKRERRFAGAPVRCSETGSRRAMEGLGQGSVGESRSRVVHAGGDLEVAGELKLRRGMLGLGLGR
ncbi:hypothetical protein ACLB2K_038357 [Fragaria x ananassa]